MCVYICMDMFCLLDVGWIFVCFWVLGRFLGFGGFFICLDFFVCFRFLLLVWFFFIYLFLFTCVTWQSKYFSPLSLHNSIYSGIKSKRLIYGCYSRFIELSGVFLQNYILQLLFWFTMVYPKVIMQYFSWINFSKTIWQVFWAFFMFVCLVFFTSIIGLIIWNSSLQNNFNSTNGRKKKCKFLQKMKK